ncbi:alpha/beta hydrolase [Fibrobacter sp. UWB11]|uniref:alpha/beta hydrolase n=1 Tax=Fibrobacter sp. UWB11 TaxID=1896202 RepID=UPI0009F8F31C|nr:alpha/beta hydrolase [Fibrobacter sp. UWB11]
MKKFKIIVMIILLMLFFIASAVYVYYVNAEAMRDVQIDCTSVIDVHPDVIEKSLSHVQTDMELGEPFKVYPIETSPDSQEVFRSTLVEYPFGSSPRADSGNNVSLRGIILYVHGYNDYYFQKELAEKADSAGFAFFAIDLHYCGRSYVSDEPRADFRNIKEFYAELDVAVELSKKIAVDDYEEAEHIPYIIIGHSQGGLISSLYINDRSEEKFAALVLNSPFLDMNFNWFMRKIGLPLISEIALFVPDFAVNTSGDPNYASSLLKRERGEWEFNETVKSYARPTQHLGWLRAVMNGQARVHSKLNIKSPILVMHSGCSVEQELWTDDYKRCDGVLNVEHIEEWAPNLGEKVTTRVIQDGLHDLYLSRKDVRDKAYRETFEFIEGHLK